MKVCTCGKEAKKLARGLCPSCYARARRNDTLFDIERHNQRLADILEEWKYLADPLIPVRAEARRLAAQLHISPTRLENIVYAHIGSRFDGGHGERIRKKAS